MVLCLGEYLILPSFYVIILSSNILRRYLSVSYFAKIKSKKEMFSLFYVTFAVHIFQVTEHTFGVSVNPMPNQLMVYPTNIINQLQHYF